MAMRTMKRRNDNDGDEQKTKPALDNRRNSLAAAIEAESERELVVREKELSFQQFKLESEMNQRELDREERQEEPRYDDIGNPQQTGQFQHTTNVKPERQQGIGIAHSAIASLGRSFFLLAHLTKKRANV
ncbi:hypothetical protein H257_04752 [Aphanomyces astaci]|uniref:Uncharacterized protein n=1 Tax=Aphanomyces astaci TaxID=112090 RepID=W4GVE3_APHAT|nr:hypothetical protein H257_04752 [Aphanomyces astaci]ETV83004.1 hypothetical protein H257_04752 [Aphanomyces astaci]|eukprot:XP_009827675.1 hypothetical protein H257_04752 [Aphanomyces astaci]